MRQRRRRVGRVRSLLSAIFSVAWAYAWMIPVVVALRMDAGAAIVVLLGTTTLFIGLYVVRPLKAKSRVAAHLRLRFCRSYLALLSLAAAMKLLLMLSTLALHEQLAARRMLPKMPDDEDVISAELLAQPLGQVALFLAIVVMAPLIEEFGFRGRMQHTLEHAFGVVPAIAASAVMFSVLHGRIDAAHHLAFGVFAGWVVWRTGSIWSAVYMHALNNAAAQLLLHLTTISTADWSDRVDVLWPYAIVAGIVGVGGLIAAGSGIHRVAQAEQRRHSGRTRSPAIAISPVV
jgi:membrane protease YdiL (CAAX protease family)